MIERKFELLPTTEELAKKKARELASFRSAIARAYESMQQRKLSERHLLLQRNGPTTRFPLSESAAVRAYWQRGGDPKEEDL